MHSPEDERAAGTDEVHAADPADQHGALVTPIDANATYEYDTTDAPRGAHRYSRMSGPTRDSLETAIAKLERGRHASAFASGMAAIDATLSLLDPGDHVVTGQSLYAETHELLTRVYTDYGVESLAEHPATVTHQNHSAAELRDAGIPPSLVRLSVGIEGERDLLADIERGLAAATEASRQ